MKAAKTTLRALLLAAAAAVMLLLASCPNPVGEMLKAEAWGLLGKWMSTQTAGDTPGYFYELTVRADGTFYAQSLNGAMKSEGTYVVDDFSVSGNSRTFRIHYTWAGINHNYVLARVSDGTSYASNYSNLLPYPAAVDSGGAGYITATLQ